MPSTLAGQVIAITGASSGIGAATALACAKAGMNVALAARREDKLRDVAQQVEALGVKAIAVRCDVDSDSDVQRFIDETVRAFGRLDAVFANAGYGLFGTVLETTEAQHRAIFETNYFGTIRTLHAALPHMLKAKRGHVLICSSAASEIGPPYYGPYAATKAAQDSIGSALRAELSGTGVHVTTVHPIGTSTEFFDRVARDANIPSARANTPIRFRQSSALVARKIVRAMSKRNPPPEVWPSLPARVGLAVVLLFPRLGAWAMRRHFKMLGKKN